MPDAFESIVLCETCCYLKSRIKKWHARLHGSVTQNLWRSPLSNHIDFWIQYMFRLNLLLERLLWNDQTPSLMSLACRWQWVQTFNPEAELMVEKFTQAQTRTVVYKKNFIIKEDAGWIAFPYILYIMCYPMWRTNRNRWCRTRFSFGVSFQSNSFIFTYEQSSCQRALHRSSFHTKQKK